MNTLNPCSGLNPNGTGPLNVKNPLINPQPRKRLGSIEKAPRHHLRGWDVRPASSHTQRTRPCRTTACIDRTHRVGRTIASRRARLTTIVRRGVAQAPLPSGVLMQLEDRT